MPPKTRQTTLKSAEAAAPQPTAQAAKPNANAFGKFNFIREPINTKAKYKGQQLQKFRIAVQGRNATINSANSYINTTMRELFAKYKPTPEYTKVYRILYKLSDGR